MRRGALRHLLHIYVPDTYDVGNEVETYKLLGKPRASVRVLEEVESSGHDRQGVELVEFTVPYSKSLEFSYQDSIVLHRGREYDVTGVRNVNYEDRELRISAKRFDGVKRLP
ncbi:head-tail adaptor protein [Vibrio fortis]|uniref:Head-tail adaptor protein n=1 Tax=Vibrio fortis TaxID=212667 RepID=A0A5N3QTE8_9VIBR|nr:head-tail adaptor protein [Vibrio fortis]KAB0285467.1 head-tail adaptor protein [Vibrio fortis]